MDLLIFVLSALTLFLSRKIEWPIVGMLVLSSDYLGIGRFFKENQLNYFQPIDLGLVLLGLIFITVLFNYNSTNKPREVKRVNNYIAVFFGFLFLTIIVDFLANGIDIWSVARTSRHWLMLLACIPLMRIPRSNLEGVIKLLYYLTLLVSSIIVFEFLTKSFYITSEARMGVEGVMRGVFPSTYALFYALLVAMGYGNHKTLVRYAIIALLTFSLLISATRSIAMGLFIGFVILVFFKSKTFWGAFNRIVAVLLLALVIIALMPSLRTRLIYGRDNFGSVDDGSTTFRMMLAQERFSYVSQYPLTFILGIGNITEDNFHGNFKIGLINTEGKQALLDTGDIAWALLFLRLGIVGTFVWIGLFIVLIRSFLRRKENLLSTPLISYLMLNLLVLSLASSAVYNGSFWVVPLIFLNIVYPTRNKIRSIRQIRSYYHVVNMRD